MVGVEVEQHPVEMLGDDMAGHDDVDVAAHPPLRLCYQTRDLRDRPEQGVALLVENLARLGHGEIARPPVDQRHADGRLQPLCRRSSC